jgi:hypothetical protein
MLKLVGMDTLNTSTPEKSHQNPPVAESGNTVRHITIGLKTSAPTLIMIC